jgi:hypothetical protein
VHKPFICEKLAIFDKTDIMNLSAEKLSIIQRICELQDPDLLDFVKNIIDIPTETKSDWWDSISDVEKQSIERGLSQVDEGKTTSHNVVRKKYEKWLKD